MLESGDLTVKDLLAQHGILTLKDFAQKAELSRQHAWLLWSGHTSVGKMTMERFHKLLGIPLEAMMRLPRVSPKIPRGRPGKPARTTVLQA